MSSRAVWMIVLIGGPYEGKQDMACALAEPPDAIRVGECSDGSCGAPVPHPHVWWWFTEGDKDAPTRTVTYRFLSKQEEPFTENGYRFNGKARYVLGGVVLPSEADERELVGTGADGGASMLGPWGGA